MRRAVEACVVHPDQASEKNYEYYLSRDVVIALNPSKQVPVRDTTRNTKHSGAHFYHNFFMCRNLRISFEEIGQDGRSAPAQATLQNCTCHTTPKIMMGTILEDLKRTLAG